MAFKPPEHRWLNRDEQHRALRANYTTTPGCTSEAENRSSLQPPGSLSCQHGRFTPYPRRSGHPPLLRVSICPFRGMVPLDTYLASPWTYVLVIFIRRIRCWPVDYRQRSWKGAFGSSRVSHRCSNPRTQVRVVSDSHPLLKPCDGCQFSNALTVIIAAIRKLFLLTVDLADMLIVRLEIHPQAVSCVLEYPRLS